MFSASAFSQRSGNSPTSEPIDHFTPKILFQGSASFGPIGLTATLGQANYTTPHNVTAVAEVWKTYLGHLASRDEPAARP